jgi:hypothetical protein
VVSYTYSRSLDMKVLVYVEFTVFFLRVIIKLLEGQITSARLPVYSLTLRLAVIQGSDGDIKLLEAL